RDYRDNNQQKTMPSRRTSSSADFCSTFYQVASTAFATTGSSAIDTARRSWSSAANFSAWLLQREALPSPRFKRIIVIDMRGSRAALFANVPFVIEVA